MPKPQTSAAEFLPETLSLLELRHAAAECRGCDLYRDATQTVFGEGSAAARVILVGEQPGDREDREGRPFVGPAGRVLDESLEEAGIDREDVYVTNAVKHFKHEPRGKRRLHEKPSARELKACRPWIAAELDVVRPDVLVCLGATAAQALIGRQFRITRQRGEFLETEWCPATMGTYHPSALLRARTSADRAELRELFVADLRSVRERL